MGKHRLVACTRLSAAVTLLLLVPSFASSGETVIADFDGADPLADWFLDLGPEYPGAIGSLDIGSGYTGNGALLLFDLSGGGQYVGARLTPAAPVHARGIAFRCRALFGLGISLRVEDESGQTLLYTPSRPLPAWDEQQWYRVAVDLTGQPRASWDGAGNGQVNGGLVSIQVMADPWDPGISSGSISFDDLALITDTVTTLHPGLTPLDPPPAGSQQFFDGLGVVIHWWENSLHFATAAAAGLGIARFTVCRHWIEPSPGQYEFQVTDAYLAMLDAWSLQGLFILSSCLDHQPGTPPSTPQEIAAFGDYAAALANRYAGRGVLWEVWNEPDLAEYWPPAPDPVAYAALASHVIARIHQTDPGAVVMSGSISKVDLAFLRAMIAAGGATGADAVSYHAYSWGGTVDGTPDPPEIALEKLLSLRKEVHQSFPGLPVFNTEWGYQAGSWGDPGSPAARQRQAVMVARLLLVSLATASEMTVYYVIEDDGPDTAGLLAAGAAKPALTAVMTFHSATAGRSFAGFYRTPYSSLHALRLAGPEDDLVALWCSAPGQQVAVVLPSLVSVSDLLGQTVPVSPGGGGQVVLTIAETDGPYYLRLPAGLLFADGFESGTTAAWSQQVPGGESILTSCTAPASPAAR